MSKLQDCILTFLRENPDGATLATIADGIDSKVPVCRKATHGLVAAGLVASEKQGHGKLWRAI